MPNPLYDALFAPRAQSDAPFLILQDGSSLTYRDFDQMADRFAHAMKGVGLKAGDRVALQVAKSAEALAVYAASVRAGFVFLPLNTAYTADEISYFVGDSQTRLLLCDGRAEASLKPVAQHHDATLLTLDADGSGSFADLAARMHATHYVADRAADDVAALLYTSGTTGRSKGAMITQGNLLSNAEALQASWQFSDQDVLLHALPIFHTHGLFVASNLSLLTGCRMIFLPGFKLDELIAYLPKATCMMGVPTFYTRLLDDPRFTKDLVGHMRLFVSGSAPLLAETHAAFEERTGHKILERYGMTETNMNTSNPLDGGRRAGTVGFPLPGVEVIVTDPETGEPLAPGQTGMIEVRGPNVFKGYWQMPEKTKQELRENGFFITGDLGKFDSNGYLTIVGRAKDLIISGGYNIYPKEVELILDDVEGVLESAVIGVAHPDFGEGVVGVIVPEDGHVLDVDAIQASLIGKVARFKQPKSLKVVEALPRNTMGKVQKNLLREQYADLFQAR